MRQTHHPQDITATGLPEILRVLRLGDPGQDLSRPLTFQPIGSDLVLGWSRWVEKVFLPHVGPALVVCHTAACSEFAREVIEVDRLLGEKLSGPLRLASCDAGSLALSTWSPPPGARVLVKLDLARARGIRLHFSSVFAARCALFGVPASLTTAAYLFKEWQCGGGGSLSGMEAPDCAGVFERICRGIAREHETPLLRAVAD